MEDIKRLINGWKMIHPPPGKFYIYFNQKEYISHLRIYERLSEERRKNKSFGNKTLRMRETHNLSQIAERWPISLISLRKTVAQFCCLWLILSPAGVYCGWLRSINILAWLTRKILPLEGAVVLVLPQQQHHCLHCLLSRLSTTAKR